jgi:hypothetical protein
MVIEDVVLRGEFTCPVSKEMDDGVPNSLRCFCSLYRNHCLYIKILIQDLKFFGKLQKFHPNSTLNNLIPVS